jgi:hypothetical protein
MVSHHLRFPRVDDGIIVLVVSYSSISHLRLAMSPLIVLDYERGNCDVEIQEDRGMDRLVVV